MRKLTRRQLYEQELKWLAQTENYPKTEVGKALAADYSRHVEKEIRCYRVPTKPVVEVSEQDRLRAEKKENFEKWRQQSKREQHERSVKYFWREGARLTAAY